MDILGIIWDLLMWGIGFFCAAIAFGVGMFFSFLLYGGAEAVGKTMNLNLNRSLVDIALRSIVFVSGLLLVFSTKVSFVDVFQSFFVSGTFDELGMELASGEYDFILNNVISVLWDQFIMVFIFFLPYFFVTEGVNLIKCVVCDPQEDLGYSLISFIPEMMTLFTTNAVVLFMGDQLAVRLLEFLQTIDLRYGLWTMLFSMLLFCFYVYRVICDLLGSDVFLTMFGANIAAMILGVQLSGGMHTIMLILCFVIGYISKTIRNAVLACFSGLNHAGIIDGYSVVYGLVSLGAMTGIFTLILKFII